MFEEVLKVWAEPRETRRLEAIFHSLGDTSTDGWPCFHDNEFPVTRLLSCDASRTGWVVLGRVPLSGLGIVLQGLSVLHSLVGPGRDLVGVLDSVVLLPAFGLTQNQQQT